MIDDFDFDPKCDDDGFVDPHLSGVRSRLVVRGTQLSTIVRKYKIHKSCVCFCCFIHDMCLNILKSVTYYLELRRSAVVCSSML